MNIVNAESERLAEVTLAVIAGGMGTRMGRPKAWLRVGGQSILGWMLDRLQWPGPKVLVTAPGVPTPPEESLFAQHVKDPVEGQGPLRGVVTALESAATPVVVTIAVDMPLVEPLHLAWLVRELDARPERLAVMSEVNVQGERQIEPFPAAHRREAASFLCGELDQGQRSLFRLCRDPRFSAVPARTDWPAEMWTNLNHPAEFAAFEASLSEPLRATGK